MAGSRYVKGLVFGVGVREAGIPYSTGVKHLLEYATWSAMLGRCYSRVSRNSSSSYKSCSVSEAFKSYAYFYNWCQNQIGFGNKGWHLDKDILVKGNKVYSEDVCVFVPPEINYFFRSNKSRRGDLPIGVIYHKPRKKYQARACTGQRKCKHIGLFTTPEEAFEAYRNFKKIIAEKMAEKYKDVIDIRVYDALINYDVKIDD